MSDVEQTLADLAAGDEDALVRELPRRPGQRETRWSHLVGDEDFDAPPEEAVAAATAPEPREPSQPRGPKPLERIEALEGEVGELKESLDALRGELLALRRRLGDLED